jgi:hypothetical protein
MKNQIFTSGSTPKKTLLLLFIVFLITSCSKDEINSPLVGKWKGIEFTASVAVDENGDGVKNTDLKKELDCISMDLDFGGGGSVKIATTQVIYDVTVENGEVIITPKGCGEDIKRGTWEVNEAHTLLQFEFVFDASQEPDRVTVQMELTGNRLVLRNLIYADVEPPVFYTVELEKM